MRGTPISEEEGEVVDLKSTGRLNTAHLLKHGIRGDPIPTAVFSLGHYKAFRTAIVLDLLSIIVLFTYHKQHRSHSPNSLTQFF